MTTVNNQNLIPASDFIEAVKEDNDDLKDLQPHQIYNIGLKRYPQYNVEELPENLQPAKPLFSNQNGQLLTISEAKELKRQQDMSPDEYNAQWGQGYLGTGFGPGIIPTEYMRNVMKAGWNESVSGLAQHYVVGSQPFRLPDEYDKDKGIVTEGLEFASSFMYDFWLNYLTAGTGTVYSRALPQAVKLNMGKQIGTRLLGNMVIEGVEKGTIQISKKAFTDLYKKEVARGGSDMFENILRGTMSLADDASSGVISKFGDDAIKLADDAVSKSTSMPNFIRDGSPLKILDKTTNTLIEEVIERPAMMALFHEGAKQSAKTLGWWTAINTLERQQIDRITAQLAQQQGIDLSELDPENEEHMKMYEQLKYQSYGLLKRWKNGDETLNSVMSAIRVDELLLETGLSIMGGYLAGGISTLNGAVRQGALGSKSKFTKFLDSYKGEAVPKWISFPAKGAEFATDVALETLGFTVPHYLAQESGVMKAVYGDDYEDQSFGEMYGHSLGTLFTLKAHHKVVDGLKGYSKEAGQILKEKVVEEGRKQLEALNKVKIKGEDLTTAEKNINETVDKAIYETSLKNREKELEIAETIQKIKELGGKEGERIDEKNIDEVSKLLDKVGELTNEYLDVENPAMPESLIKRINSLDKITKEWNSAKEQLEYSSRENKEREEKTADYENKEIEIEGEGGKTTKTTLGEIKEVVDKSLEESGLKVNFKDIVVQAEKDLDGKYVRKVRAIKTTPDRTAEEKTANRENQDMMLLYKENYGDKQFKDQYLSPVKTFASWLWNNHRKSLRDATAEDVKHFIRKQGDNFGPTASRNLNRFFRDTDGYGKADKRGGRKFNRFKYGTGSKRKTDNLTVEELVTMPENVKYESSNQSGPTVVLKEGKGGKANLSIKNEGYRVVHWLLTLGKRGKGITSPKVGDLIYKSDGQGGQVLWGIRLTEKGSKTVDVKIPDRMLEDVNSLAHSGKQRRGSGEALITTLNSKGGEKGLTGDGLRSIVKHLVGEGRYNEGVKPHRFRNTLMHIAIALDKMGIKIESEGLEGATWTNFVDIGLLNHKYDIGASKVGQDKYGPRDKYTAEEVQTLASELYTKLKQHNVKIEKEDIQLANEIFKGNNGETSSTKVGKKNKKWNAELSDDKIDEQSGKEPKKKITIVNKGEKENIEVEQKESPSVSIEKAIETKKEESKQKAQEKLNETKKVKGKPKFDKNYTEKNFKEDLAIVGNDIINSAQGNIGIQQFSKLMEATFGEGVRPYLKDAFKAAKEYQFKVPEYIVKETKKRLDESLKYEERVPDELSGKERQDKIDELNSENFEIKQRLKDRVKKEGLDEEMISLVADKAGLPKNFTLEGANTKEELDMFEVTFNSIDWTNFGSTGKLNQKPSIKNLKKKAKLLEISHGLRDVTTRRLKRVLGMPKSSLKFASEKQIVEYIAWIKKISEKLPKNENVFEQKVWDVLKSNDSNFKKFFKGVTNMATPAYVVLSKFGGKYGRSLARKMLDHSMLEAWYFGHGDVSLRKIQRLVGNKNLSNMWMVDNARVSQDFLDANPKQAEFYKRMKTPGTSEWAAAKEMKALTDFYWTSLKHEAKQVMNPKEYEDFLKTFDKKFVADYFTRTLTPEAKAVLEVDTKQREKHIGKFAQQIAEQIANDFIAKGQTLSYGKRLEVLKDHLSKAKTETHKNKIKKRIEEVEKLVNDKYLAEVGSNRVRKEALMRMEQALKFAPDQLKNKYFLKRGPLIEDKLVDANGKEIQTYETNFDRSMGRYIRTMSKYLATVRHFNEYTEIKGKHSNFDAAAKLSEIKAASEIGGYAAKLFERVTGLNQGDMTQGYFAPTLKSFTKASAVLGLSSPLAGEKNLIIGAVQTIGAFGWKPWMGGWFRGLTNSDFRSYVRELGGIELGTKEMEITGLTSYYFKYINLMQPTEAANRIVATYAGISTAKEMARVLNGKSSWLRNKFTTNAEGKFKDLWYFSKDEITFVRNYGLETGKHGTGKEGKIIDKKIEELIDKIGHYSHIRTQGTTADVFLPLWAGSEVGHATTLFYRMAYVGTHSIFRNIVKPLVPGKHNKGRINPFPAMRYIMAANIGGALYTQTMWYLFGWESGDNTRDKSFRERMLSLDAFSTNIAKAEGLGLFTRVIEHNRAGTTTLMEPAIIRNVVTAAANLMHFMGIGSFKDLLQPNKWFQNPSKNLPQAVDDTFKNIAVVYNHMSRNLELKHHPYKNKAKRIKRLQDRFVMELGLEDKIIPYNGLPFQGDKWIYYNDFKNAWQTRDWDNAAKLYWATYFHLVDSYWNGNDGEPIRGEGWAHKEAQKSMNLIMSGLHPVDNGLVSEVENGKILGSYKSQFYNWIKDPKVKQMVSDMDQAYIYDRKAFQEKINEYEKKYQLLYYKKGEKVNLNHILHNITLGQSGLKYGKTKTKKNKIIEKYYQNLKMPMTQQMQGMDLD